MAWELMFAPPLTKFVVYVVLYMRQVEVRDRAQVLLLKAGARGYLLKDTDRETLFRAIRVAACNVPSKHI